MMCLSLIPFLQAVGGIVTYSNTEAVALPPSYLFANAIGGLAAIVVLFRIGYSLMRHKSADSCVGDQLFAL